MIIHDIIAPGVARNFQDVFLKRCGQFHRDSGIGNYNERSRRT